MHFPNHYLEFALSMLDVGGCKPSILSIKWPKNSQAATSIQLPSRRTNISHLGKKGNASSQLPLGGRILLMEEILHQLIVYPIIYKVSRTCNRWLALKSLNHQTVREFVFQEDTGYRDTIPHFCTCVNFESSFSKAIFSSSAWTGGFARYQRPGGDSVPINWGTREHIPPNREVRKIIDCKSAKR